MALIYPHEERARSRHAVDRLNTLAQEAKRAAERGLILPPTTEAGIIQLTGTSERSSQVDALTNLANELQKRHLDKLLPLAHDEFNAFCEYVSPDEPPSSRWHMFLTDTLQRIEFDPELDRFILNCPPGHAKPLHVDTLVLMGDGSYRRLGDIKPGDYVISHTGAIRLVTAVHDQGELPLLKITTAMGRVIYSAYDHPFRVKDGWKTAEALRPGDPLTMIGRPAQHDAARDFSGQSLDMFRLAGFHAVCGSWTQTHSSAPVPSDNFQLWLHNRTEVETVGPILDRLGLRYACHWLPSNERHLLRMRSVDANAYIDILRLRSKAANRRIPAWVFLGSDEKVKAYLTTVLTLRCELPQYPKTATLKVRLASPDYARDLQRLLARFGVSAEVMATKGTGSSATTYVQVKAGAIETLIAAGINFAGAGESRFVEKRAAEPTPLADQVHMVEPAEPGPCKCLTVRTDESFVVEGAAVHNSTYASRLFVAWRLGRNPNLRIIGGGHSQRFVENEFSAKIRNLIRAPDYKRVFPEVVVDYETRAKDQWAIAGKGGQYAAKGVGQAVHGFRANFICVDDPYAKIEEAESAVQREKVNTWFTGDLGSRMLPFGKMFLIMTRFHEEDLTGYLMDMNPRLPVYARWHQVEAPALCIDPETDVLGRKLGDVLWDYYDLSYFVTKKTEWTFQRFSLVYQQNASATATDNVSGQFEYYDVPPHLEDAALKKAREEGHVDEQGRTKPNRRAYFRKVILSVDTASKPTERADYTVIQTWGETNDRQYYLLRQTRLKVDFNSMIEAIEKQAIRDQVDAILVEDKGQGTAYIQNRGSTNFQRRLAPAPIVPIDPKGQSKEFRFDEVSPMIAAGDVYLPKRAKWLDAFIKEVGQFPDGAHDDQVDSMSQALRYFKTNRTRYGTRKITSHG
jgi:predicted phage terminase large subunit-like protein